MHRLAALRFKRHEPCQNPGQRQACPKQIHGNGKAEISFRNLTIGDLSCGVAAREFGLSKTRWKILSFSSENTQAEDERAVLAIDGKPDTFWHTLWNGGSPGHPHHLAVDLAEEIEITGFTYVPRQDGRHIKGVIGDYEFHVSRDGKDWGQPVAKRPFREDRPGRQRSRGAADPAGDGAVFQAGVVERPRQRTLRRGR